ncbi:MAG: exosortase family protein XrtG [Thermoflexaceae bacterium]|nr:exosortase family protein XrtG [Thermoflexaceae bacterium]
MIIKIALIVAWIYVLSVLRRGKLGFYHFLLGSVGTFLILLGLLPYIKGYFISGFVDVIGIAGKLTGMYESYAEYGMIFINHGDTVMSLYVDMECSGIIEMMVFVSLLGFFPAYKFPEKIKTGILGVFLICVFNFIRIFVIIALIFVFGSSVYSLAHAIIGRLIFYVLTLTLYFYVFTKKQIMKQKVGKFSYEGTDDQQ